jgi:hypothetical protein
VDQNSVLTHEKPWDILLQRIKEEKTYRVFELLPSSGILENRKHNVSETGCFSVLK